MAESKTTAGSRRSSRIAHDEKRIQNLRDRGNYLGVVSEEDNKGNRVFKSGSTLKFSGRSGMWSGRAGRAPRPDFVYVEPVRLAGTLDDIIGYLAAAGYSDEDIDTYLSEENVFVRNDPREGDSDVIRAFTGGSAAPGIEESGPLPPEQELLSFAQALIPDRYNATQPGAGVSGIASPRTRQSLIERVRNAETNLVVSKIDEEGKGVTSRKVLPTGTRTQLRAHPDLPNVYSDNADAYSTAMNILADQDRNNADFYTRLAEEFPNVGLSPAEIQGGGPRASPRPATARRGGRGIGSQVRAPSRPSTVRRPAAAGPPTEAKEDVISSTVPRTQTGPGASRGRGRGRGGLRFHVPSARRTEAGSRSGSPGRQ